MIDKTKWSKFIDATSDGAYNSAIAEKVGVDPATIGRWRTGAVDPKPRQVVAYARAYGLNPIQALIAANYLTPEEAAIPIAAPKAYALEDFTPLELAEELTVRLSDVEGYSYSVRNGEPSFARIEDGRIVSVSRAEALGVNDGHDEQAAASVRDGDRGEDTDYT